MSDVGKFVIARKISKQLEKRNIANLRLHEEMKNHPIRDGEFTAGSLYTKEEMQKIFRTWLKDGAYFRKTIVNADHIYVMEGCFYDNKTAAFPVFIACSSSPA